MRCWLKSVFGRGNPSAPLQSLRYVVLDTELTSLDARSNRMLSAGAVAMQGMTIRLGEQFYRVVNPQEEIPAETIVIHGLRPADVARGESPEQVVSELAEFIGDAVIVGHFVKIDVQVLRKELQRVSRTLPNEALDTARAHHWMVSNEARKRGVDDVNCPLDLATVAAGYGLAAPESHHALHDAFLTAQLWQKLLPGLIAHGITTLDDALRIARG